jgi:multidrug efflux pump subunit AcrB
MILPSHLAGSKRKLAGKKASPESEKSISRYLKLFIAGPYNTFLRLCLRWRYATVGCGIALLMLMLGVWQGGWLKFTLFPKVESDLLICTLTMPAGTPVSHTSDIVAHLEKTGRKILSDEDQARPADAPPLLEHSVSFIGLHGRGAGPHGAGPKYGGHMGQVYIQLLEGEERDVSAARLASLWREKAGPVPEAESITFQSELFSMGTPIEIHLSLDDHEQLISAADELKTELSGYPGVFDINDSFLPGKKEMQLKLKPAARSLGLTLNDLAQQVRHGFYGAEALRLQRDQDEVKVLVRYPESERKSLIHVEDMRIRTLEGSEVPFKQVAQIRMEQGYSTIERAQRRRVIKVTADVDEAVSNANEVRKELEAGFLQQLKNRFPGLRYKVEGEGKEQKEAMQDVTKGAAMAILAIYALLAIPFRSFTQPLIVLSAIPFGLIGALLGHLIMGLNLSMLSVFGIVGAAGVVVNDSLVLIHATNRFRAQGMRAIDAVRQAAPLRFRAIILTSLTTFAGLTPMLLERSMQAKFMIPMAVSLAFGVLFATVITLLLIPCGYVIMDDIHNLTDRLKDKIMGRTDGGQL